MKRRRSDLLIHLVLIAIATITLLPFAFVIDNSMRRTSEQYYSFFGVPAAMSDLVQFTWFKVTGQPERIQVRVLPVSEKVADYAARVAEVCRAGGLRAEADLRNEELGYKVREAQLEKIPMIAVVGEREAAAGTVAPRTANPKEEAVPLADYVVSVAAEARTPGGVL